MSTDTSALASLKALIPAIRELSPSNSAVLHQLYKAIGPEMPKNLKSTRIQSPIPNAEVLTYNYDEGHSGRVSVPATPGGSVDFQWLIKQSPFAKFVLNHLLFRDADDLKRTFSGHEHLVFFIPGLNTLHQPRSGETSTMQRLAYYTKVLQIVPMAQIHIGTSFDQGDIKIDASQAPALRALIRANNEQIPANFRPTFDDGKTLIWNARNADTFQLALSQLNVIDTPIKQSIRTLLETSSEKNAAPFVLVGYSRGAGECEAALRQYIAESEKKEAKADIETRLRERVTVVSIGSISHDYPDGPAYVHVAAWTDQASTTTGVTSKNNVEGAGKDAVFVNFSSPYNAESFDNHNFGAVSVQYLSLLLAMNKVKGLRDLWEMGHAGKINVPKNVDEMLRAMIEMTKGYEWLWDEATAKKGLTVDTFPHIGAAEALLRHKVGHGFVDRLQRNFS